MFLFFLHQYPGGHAVESSSRVSSHMYSLGQLRWETKSTARFLRHQYPGGQERFENIERGWLIWTLLSLHQELKNKHKNIEISVHIPRTGHGRLQVLSRSFSDAVHKNGAANHNFVLTSKLKYKSKLIIQRLCHFSKNTAATSCNRRHLVFYPNDGKTWWPGVTSRLPHPSRSSPILTIFVQFWYIIA